MTVTSKRFGWHVKGPGLALLPLPPSYGHVKGDSNKSFFYADFRPPGGLDTFDTPEKF